jgi:hypothetical protein
LSLLDIEEIPAIQSDNLGGALYRKKDGEGEQTHGGSFGNRKNV